MNVTYLLGAGASAYSIPTVSEFKNRLMQLRHTLDGPPMFLQPKMNDSERHRLSAAQRRLGKFCGDLINLLESFSSIDTYARYLYYTNPSELKKLGAFINFCFSYWQLTSEPDKRYDALMSLLISGNSNQPKLRDNVRIITWNYDLQLESCLAKYFKKPDLNQLGLVVRIFPKMVTTPEVDGSFALLKLNGSAQMYHIAETRKIYHSPFNFEHIHSENQKKNNKVFSSKMCELLGEFDMLSESDEADSFISYSWTESNIASEVLQRAIQETSDTNILVIIGYSFPLINRSIDSQIFNAMRKINAVYIQDHDVKSAEDSVRKLYPYFQKDIIQPIRYDSPFFVPEQLVDQR